MIQHIINSVNYVMLFYSDLNTKVFTSPPTLCNLCRLMQCKAITVSIQQQAGESRFGSSKSDGLDTFSKAFHNSKVPDCGGTEKQYSVYNPRL